MGILFSQRCLKIGCDQNLPAMQKTWVWSLSWEDSPGEGEGYSLQYSGLENSTGQRDLAGYSLWGLKESDTTE